MKVFVAGGTGVIGWRAVRGLVEAGHIVTVIARSPEKAELVRSLGATPVRVSLFDPEGLVAAMRGHDAVVNLATSIPPLREAIRPSSWQENNRIRSEGAANLADAAIATGATRFVQESITFTYPDRGDEWIDAESVAVEPTPPIRAVLDAEAAAQRFTEAGGTGVVLRFAAFYAPEASHTRDTFAAARAGVGGMMGAATAYQSSIHADDAASAAVAALGAPAGIYDIADDEPVTKAAYADAAGAAVGRRRLLHLPGRAGRVGGSSNAALMRSQRISNRRFKDATGWAPAYRSVRDGFPAVAAEMDPPRPLLERLVRPVLVVLVLVHAQLGLWASIAPRSFYDDFPQGARRWVAVDGPFNEHLVRDFGSLNLALTVVLVGALLRPSRWLVRVAALAYLVNAVPHLLYHATHLDVYGSSDKVLNVVSLGMAVAGGAVLVLGSQTMDRPAEPHPSSRAAIRPAEPPTA